MSEHTAKVGELLHEAAETHHQVFRITDGVDDDWASTTWGGQPTNGSPPRKWTASPTSSAR